MSALFILQTFLPSRRRDCLSCTQPLYPHNHCKRTTHPCSALNLPPLSKVRCCRPKKFGRLPEGLPHRHPLHCTNPLEPALSLENSHHPRLLMNALPVSHPHYPLPRTTTLASLVKGRWLDGKAQTIALLRFTCNTSAFLFTKLFCRQDGGIAIPPFAQHHIYASLVKGEVLSPEKNRATTGGIATPLSLASHQPSQNCTIPRPAPPHLPPLSKGGGLTARHKLLLCCVLLAICPLFLYCKLFCRQDGGIASVASTLSIPTTFSKALPPFATHHPFQNLITPQFLIIPHPTFISFLHTLDNFRR